ncbi:hypothetical protein [Salmonella phage S134]|uniref:Uncharacterized protein n=1 Tax=Salmonella phage 5sent1 TaxID=2762669 RepID=A0A7G8ANN9_9CAUD|nr:hypothetical protein QA030_gp05 [Salmonella phage 5sent1]AXC39550.1 hypothetical protein [Salmonella phage S101]AXC39742.1 hypothetical protein [Salmonella phage S104]AXC42087.1 hypothetical protein [Salmonella phage S134]AXC42321.1 hypothetical protein [Salmonella phage S138]AXC42388.1 hypothetical protein [Salmonella phage S142]
MQRAGVADWTDAGIMDTNADQPLPVETEVTVKSLNQRNNNKSSEQKTP